MLVIFSLEISSPPCQPTVFRHHSEGDTGACIFDELDDVVVRQLHDGQAVDSRDTVSHLHLTYAVGGAALNNTADLVRYHCNREAREKLLFLHV